MKPILSIAIPSNNRTDLLDEALRSILAEPGFDQRSEICISDNSGGNSTQQLIAAQYAGTPRIVYRRSLDAPSLDENVNQVVAMANGEYAWVFGDDDLIVPGFLAELVDHLERAAPDILLVNSSSFQGSGVVEASRVPRTDIGIYGPADNDEFLADFGGYLTYVPCLVIRHSLWIAHFRRSKVGTFFAHIDAVYRAKRGHSAHFLPQPGIAMRLHFQTWSARHFEIWNIHFPAVIWGLDGYSEKAKAAVIPRFPLKSLRRILGSRAYGRFNLKIWRAVLQRSPDATPLVKMFGLMIALLPRELFRLLYIGFIRAKRRRHRRGFSPELALAQLGRQK
jgi:glycosyltransferase involved in cell wall biosynthesis